MKSQESSARSGLSSKQAVLNIVQDCVFSVIASLLTVIFVRWLVQHPIPGFTLVALIWLFASLIATLVACLASGSSKTVVRHATINAVSSRVAAILVKEAILVLFLIVYTHWFSIPSILITLTIVLDAAFTAVALFCPVVILRKLEKARAVDITKEVSLPNALVVGRDDESFIYARQLQSQGNFNVIGLLSSNNDDEGLVVGDFKVYYAGSSEDLEKLGWRLGGIDCIFFPKSNTGSDKPSNSSKSDFSHSDNMSFFGKVVKRSFDLVLSSVLIIIFSPLALACAIAIKLEDGEKVLFRQERVGLHGRTFNILKFRSMIPNAEASGAMLYSGETDPRLTRVGGFLRAHHLDELPQLLNVFLGDMSFVGYRPERLCYIEQISERNPRYSFLYQIRPGVTSYATLYNGYTDTLEKMLTRLDLDLYYLRHHSVGFDLKVLWLTFFSIVAGKKF